MKGVFVRGVVARSLALGIVVLGGCGSGSGDDPVAAGFGVVEADGALRDATRGRSVPYRLYAPAGRAGPLPVVLVSHGGTGNRLGYTTGAHVGRALAEAGFLSIHVGHRASDDLATHLLDRPADVGLVLDRLEDGGIALPPGVDGTPDISRIGHAGHSLGAYTAHAVGGATYRRTSADSRVIAIAPISPQGPGVFGGFDRGPSDNTWTTVQVPAFDLVGSEEVDGNETGSVNEPGWRLVPFARYPAEGDKFLTVIDGQDHRDMWDRGDEAVREYVAGQLVRFFSVYVEGDPTASACDIGGPADGDVEVTTERLADADASALRLCP